MIETEVEITETDRWGNPKYLMLGIWATLTVLNILRALKNLEYHREWWMATGPMRESYF